RMELSELMGKLRGRSELSIVLSPWTQGPPERRSILTHWCRSDTTPGKHPFNCPSRWEARPFKCSPNGHASPRSGSGEEKLARLSPPVPFDGEQRWRSRPGLLRRDDSHPRLPQRRDRAEVKNCD